MPADAMRALRRLITELRPIYAWATTRSNQERDPCLEACAAQRVSWRTNRAVRAVRNDREHGDDEPQRNAPHTARQMSSRCPRLTCAGAS